jgi:hypothetical protein
MGVDPGDSTDIIHKRILKERTCSEAGRGDPRVRISPETGFIYVELSGIVRPDVPSEPDRGDLQMKYSSVSI